MKWKFLHELLDVLFRPYGGKRVLTAVDRQGRVQNIHAVSDLEYDVSRKVTEIYRRRKRAYCSPHLFNSMERTLENIVRVRVLHMEINFRHYGDDPEKAESAILRALFSVGVAFPVITRSENGFQLFWILNHPLSPEDWVRAQSYIQRTFKKAGLKFSPGSMSLRWMFPLEAKLVTRVREYTIGDLFDFSKTGRLSIARRMRHDKRR